MPYSADVVRRARRVLESRKADHESRQQARLQEVYDKLPRVRQIDISLRSSMVEAAQAAFLGGANTMQQVKKKILEYLILEMYSILQNKETKIA